MARLKAGIVGAGGGAGVSRGTSFVRICRALGEEVDVVAICDIVPEYADRVAREVGAQSFDDYDSFLEAGIDLVVIATPLRLHADQAARALDAGIHVLSEVTACHDMASARRLALAARQSKAIYMLAENYHYLDEVELIRRMVVAGRFGEPYYAEGEYLHDCRDLFRNPDGSLTWRGQGWPGLYCTHSLGPLLYILDDRVVRVTSLDTGRPSRLDPEISFPESSVFLARTGAGRLLRIRVDYQSPRPHNMAYYALQGTAGAYEARRGLGDQAKVWLMDEHEPSRVGAKKGEPISAWHPLADYGAQYIPDRLAVGPEARLGGHGTSEYWMLKEFFDAVRGHRQPPIDIFRALDYTVPGLCAVVSAERGGEPVDVPDFRDV
jgi:predicted dehydrogenase